MAELLLIQNEILFLTLNQSTMSGTVTVDAIPKSRFIGLYRDATMDFITSTSSDAVTGAWSITVESGPLDKFKIICFGEDDENDQIFKNVSGV